METTKRPTGITVIGVIFIIAGSIAGLDIIQDAFRQQLNLNFAVLMIPVGMGLLKGKSSSLTWAKFWIGLFIGVTALLILGYPFFGDSYSVNWFSRELHGTARHIVAVGFSLLMIIPGVIIWWYLSSTTATAFFERHSENNSA